MSLDILLIFIVVLSTIFIIFYRIGYGMGHAAGMINNEDKYNDREDKFKEELKFLILTNSDCTKFTQKELDDIVNNIVKIQATQPSCTRKSLPHS